MEAELIPQRLAFYRQFVRQGDLCFDIGANIGNRTEIFLALGGKVVAVEPQNECAQQLKLRFGKSIELVRKALGDKEGEATIYISETSEISSLSRDWIHAVSKSRFSNKEWKNKKQIPVSTLDKLIETYGVPRFCKIDVEGYETEVLRGLSHSIPIISFEYTIPERVDQVSGCVALLSDIGKFEYNYTISENTKMELSDWISDIAIVDEIKRISDKCLFGDIYVRFIGSNNDDKQPISDR